MSGFAYRAVMTLAAISLALPAGAQQPSAPKIVWNLGWQDSQCTLTTGTDSLGFALWLLPGDPAPDIYIVGVPQLISPSSARNVTVTVLPGGETFQGQVSQKAFTRPVLPITQLGDEFLAAFAKADALQVTTQKGSATIPVKGAAKAMTALNECRDVKLQEWGIDPKVLASVRSQPSRIQKGGVITADDYPRAALDRNETGAVVARLDIDVQGKVANCAVVVSSRSSALDSATCAILRQRARFTPAVSPDGRPLPSVRVTRINWMIG